MSLDDNRKLISHYFRTFQNVDGEEVLKDLRKFSAMDEPAGASLSHQECAYRNAMRDFYLYIEAMVVGEDG